MWLNLSSIKGLRAFSIHVSRKGLGPIMQTYFREFLIGLILQMKPKI